MLILGINAAFEESSAALVRDGRIVMAVEEERLTRVKHAKRARPCDADALPWNAIERCLDAAGAKLRDVDAIGFSFAPRRPTGFELHPWSTEDPDGERERRVRGVPALLAARANASALAERVELLPHHLCHAASAFYTSPFESAAVLVLDSVGESTTAWLGRGRGARLSRIEEVPRPHSIGLLWQRLAQWLGWNELDTGKVRDLAAFGDASLARDAIDSILRVGSDDDALPFEVDAAIAAHGGVEELERLLGPRRVREPVLEVPRFAAAAAALQERTEEALLATARRLARATGETALAYAGDVAMNAAANARLEREGPFISLHVCGAAHDAGTALGAALALCARFREELLDERPVGMALGPAYDERDMERALLASGLRSRRVSDPCREAAERIAAGAIVGWFQDRME
ncbi:MAG TPA: carbamoyltransferase N-terminal domain-containing protein, partial [Sandaracinaceae bacterium]